MNRFSVKKVLTDFLQTGTTCAFWTPEQWGAEPYEPNYPGMIREEAALYKGGTKNGQCAGPRFRTEGTPEANGVGCAEK
jgi:hypothetical protein